HRPRRLNHGHAIATPGTSFAHWHAGVFDTGAEAASARRASRRHIMQFVKTASVRAAIDGDNLPRKIECEQCGADAELRAVFHYYDPVGRRAEQFDPPMPQIVMVVNCPICGPLTHIKPIDCELVY